MNLKHAEKILVFQEFLTFFVFMKTILIKKVYKEYFFVAASIKPVHQCMNWKNDDRPVIAV